MTDRNIIKAYNTYIAALRKNIPLEEEERCTYFSDCKDMIYRNLDEDEGSEKGKPTKGFSLSG